MSRIDHIGIRYISVLESAGRVLTSAFLAVSSKMGNQSSRRRSLHRAIWKRDINRVEQILNTGLKVQNDMLALEIASLKGQEAIVELLLQNKCFPRGSRRCRALDLAVWKKHSGVATILIEAGCDCKSRNQFGETLLYVAACGNNSVLTEVLIQLGVDMNEMTRGWTALHVAAQRNHTDVLKVLIKHGCDVNMKDKDGNIPLNLALAQGHLENVQFLLQGGSEYNFKELVAQEYVQAQFSRNPEIEKLIRADVEKPKPLMELCRRKIRKVLGTKLPDGVKELPLPPRMKSFIKMTDVYTSES